MIGASPVFVRFSKPPMVIFPPHFDMLKTLEALLDLVQLPPAPFCLCTPNKKFKIRDSLQLLCSDLLCPRERHRPVLKVRVPWVRQEHVVIFCHFRRRGETELLCNAKGFGRTSASTSRTFRVGFRRTLRRRILIKAGENMNIGKVRRFLY